MGYPRGLIRYSTENAMAGRETRIFRPRIFIYIAALLALSAVVGLIIVGREPLLVDATEIATRLLGDAIGTNLEGPPRGRTLDVITVLNHAQEGCCVISLDTPTGLDVDDGTLRMARAALAALDEIEGTIGRT